MLMSGESNTGNFVAANYLKNGAAQAIPNYGYAEMRGQVFDGGRYLLKPNWQAVGASIFYGWILKPFLAELSWLRLFSSLKTFLETGEA